MRYLAMFAGVLTASMVLVAGLDSPAAVASERVCLKIRDLGNLKPINDTTLMATSRSQGNFVVKLRGPCRDFKNIGDYPTVRALSQQECFDGDDVLQFRYGGLCFVESVTPAK